jgi:hypothetical protein
MILLTLLITCSVGSQDIDSIKAKNLRLLINEYEFLDSAYTSALHEIRLCDSSLTLQFNQIMLLSNSNFSLHEQNYLLRKMIDEYKQQELKWYHFAGYGIMIMVIGILIGAGL